MVTTDDSKSYEVCLSGLPIKLRSSHGQEVVDEIVEVVESKVKELTQQNQHLSFQNSMLLAALHLAEDLINIKKSAKIDLEQIQEQTQKLFVEFESSSLLSQEGIES